MQKNRSQYIFSNPANFTTLLHIQFIESLCSYSSHIKAILVSVIWAEHVPLIPAVIKLFEIVLTAYQFPITTNTTPFLLP